MKANGWTYYHSPDNRPINGHIQNVKAGFPDLTAVRGTRLIFAELKRELGETSDKQDAWLEQLAATGHAEVYVWRPSDLVLVKKILAPIW